MAAKQNLGEWGAREVDLGQGPAHPGGPRSDRMPGRSGADPGDGSGGREPDRSSGRPTFWMGVVVGLVPLVALAGGLVGYQLATDDGDSAATETETEASGIGGVAVAPDQDEPVDGTDLTVETSTTIAPEPEPLVAAGVVADGVIQVSGLLPAEVAELWMADVTDLATTLNVSLLDRTEIAETPAVGDTGPAELVVRFPEAVVFAENSPESFASNPTAVFEAVAGVLNRGVARLNIAGYADPSDPDGALLAISRAEHIHEHLLELGVAPERLTVQVAAPGTAPDAGPGGAPVEGRVDLEFRFSG